MPRNVSLCALVLLLNISRLALAGEVQLGNRRFTIPDGMELSVAAGPPLVDRPICVDFDERGRLYVAESSGTNDDVQTQLREKPHRILRLEDTDGDGRFDNRVVFADKLMFPEGTLWHDGSLYVAAPPSIWKLTDTDGDGVADRREEWFAGKTLTGCANDLHGPYLGPDGWIYWCKGAFAEQTYKRDGKPPLVTRAAHIFRRRPEGGPIEPVMTGGMDNPVEVAFTPGGERIFTTTFLQHPRGGRRDGLIHAIYGGVYGKIHGVIDSHPRTGDVMPVLVHLGAAAPCGLTRLESDLLGTSYQHSLLTACFNLHKVTRHILRPHGSSFDTQDSDFLVCDDLDFHPTDVIEDADGSVLVVDTGGWYKLCCPTSQLHKPDVLGAIYRLRRGDPPKLNDAWGRQVRWNDASDSALVELLGDPRPAVRRHAQRELANRGARGVPLLSQAVRQSPRAAHRRQAVWTLCQIDAPEARVATRAALVDQDEQVRQAAIHAASVWRDRGSAEALRELLRSDSHHNRRAAAEALGRLGDAASVPTLLQAIRADNDRGLDHSLIHALIEIDDATSTARGLLSGGADRRRAALLALEQMESGRLQPHQVIPSLDSEDPALRAASLFVAKRHPEWGNALADYLREAISQPSLAKNEFDRQRHLLANLAMHSEVRDFMGHALADPALEVDRKLLIVRAMAESDQAPLAENWIEPLGRLLSSDRPELVAAAVGTLVELTPKAEQRQRISARLKAVARDSGFAPDVRLQALRSLVEESTQLDDVEFELALEHADARRAVAQRSAAADILARASLSPAQLRGLAAALRTMGPLELDRIVGAFEKSSDTRLGLDLVAALARSPSTASLRPERLEAILAAFGPEVVATADPLLSAATLTTVEKAQRLDEVLAALPEGDVRGGQRLFHSRQLACADCHSMGYLGGDVGPDLTRIARVRSQRDLLESLMFPSVSFVRSYEPVNVVTADGQAWNGIIKDQTEDMVVLVTGAREQRRIARENIEQILPGQVSVMPTGLDKQMTMQQLADLLAFLQAAK